MANNPSPAPVDPQNLKTAQETWHNFAVAMKWGVITSVAILAMMAVTLL